MELNELMEKSTDLGDSKERNYRDPTTNAQSSERLQLRTSNDELLPCIQEDQSMHPSSEASLSLKGDESGRNISMQQSLFPKNVLAFSFQINYQNLNS